MAISQIIDKLITILKEDPSKTKFHNGMDPNTIITYENAYNIIFPKSYKEFLEWSNGGMILERRDTFYIDMLDFEPDGPKWSSFYFYPLEDMIAKYYELYLSNWLFDDKSYNSYPVIPICRMPGWGEEFFFIISQKGLKNESPVFAKLLDNKKEICFEVAKDFESFMSWYVKHKGFPPIKEMSQKKVLNQFTIKNNVFEIAQKQSTREEDIIQATAWLKLFPNDDFYYCKRGNAYTYIKKAKEALADYNKAIELKSNDAFYYYCRGGLLLEYGSQRKALIDMDVSVNLEPDNLLYISGRADAFHQLGRLKNALEDCNKVLEIDGRYELALHTRKSVYQDLGEHKKAQADENILEDIYNGE